MATSRNEEISALYYRTIEMASRIKEGRCIYCGEPGRFVYDGCQVTTCCRRCWQAFYDDDYDDALIDTEVL